MNVFCFCLEGQLLRKSPVRSCLCMQLPGHGRRNQHRRAGEIVPLPLRVVVCRLRMVVDHHLAGERRASVRRHQNRSILHVAGPMLAVLEAGSHSREREKRVLQELVLP